ncbi:MAG: 1-acyl-sn-glycerol-3-phosphate acyltransferase [Neisseria sp.]|nr:1-acyl-sn-glycerol-3-phosphate acyltransferase [Neisseria sp.]
MVRQEVGHMVLAWRLLRVGGHLLAGFVEIVALFPLMSPDKRKRRIRAWSKHLLAICAVRAEVYGLPEKVGGRMVLANHVSWLDIFALNSCGALCFVAKSEINRWPLLGFLTRHTGTVFVERARRGTVNATVRQLDELLAAGEDVAVFPEGTTGSGEEVKPFKSSLLQAASAGAYAVQPVALRYPLPDGRCDVGMAYYGSTSLWQSVRRVLRGRHNVVELYFLPELPAGALSRNAVADMAHAQIAGCLAVRAAAQQHTFCGWQEHETSEPLMVSA